MYFEKVMLFFSENQDNYVYQNQKGFKGLIFAVVFLLNTYLIMLFIRKSRKTILSEQTYKNLVNKS